MQIHKLARWRLVGNVSFLLAMILAIFLTANSTFGQTLSETNEMHKAESLQVITDSSKYFPGQTVIINGEVLDESGQKLETTITIEVRNNERIVYSVSKFSDGGRFHDDGLKLQNTGSYTVIAYEKLHKETSVQNAILVIEWYQADVTKYFILAMASFASYVIFVINTIKQGKEKTDKKVDGAKSHHRINIVQNEIIRFILITSIIGAVISIFVFIDIQVGKDGPFGIVVKEITKVQGNGFDTSQEWVINIGGSVRDGYKDGLQIPILVIIFGTLGGYLRFLYISSRPWLRDQLNEEIKLDPNITTKKALWCEVRKKLEEAYDGNFSSVRLRRLLYLKTLKDMVLLFLSPLLATVLYFILGQGGINAENNFFTIAITSLTAGLFTDQIIGRLEDYVTNLIFPKKKEDKNGKTTNNGEEQTKTSMSNEHGRTFEFTNATGSYVEKLTLEFKSPIGEIEYIDEIAPSSPKRPYDYVLLDNNTKIVISRIKKNTGDVLKLAIKTEQEPKVKKAIWTLEHGGGDKEIPRKWLIEKGYSDSD